MGTADIFISYSSQDKAQAHDLQHQLKTAGFSCWIDQLGIGAASQWSSEIVQAIENCKVFIILLSNASLKSRHVINELLLAFEEKKHLVPIILEPVKLTHELKYQLAGLQQVSIKEQDRIITAIRRFIGEIHTAEAESPPLIVTHRHLLAVMFTDIQGFSRIMNTDESLGIETLRFHNDFMRKTIESSEGRVVEIIGDGILSVFESAVRAVGAGIAIQEGLKEHNTELPEGQRFLVRVGIHMGDIIEESGGIKGDAVNIAARIQAIAPGGGVAISETVYEAVKHKMPLEVISQGAKKLKNIEDPYTIYNLKLSSYSSKEKNLHPRDPQTIQHPTLDIRRLAVLPFDDLSPNHDNEWFADGLTDELITTLNKLDQVFVLDRLSSREYKNSKLNSNQIAQELQVRYIINGAVRKQEKNIRVQATLIDTETGKTLWDEKFSGTMDDIFEIQEKTAKDIADGLKLKLEPEEEKKIARKETANAEAYELYLRAVDYFDRHTKQDLLKAITHYQEAVKLDPKFAHGLASLSNTYSEYYRTYEHNNDLLESALDTALKSLMLDPNSSTAYRALSQVYSLKGNVEAAIQAAKKSIEIDPQTWRNYSQLGFLYAQTGQLAEAAKQYEEALEIASDNKDIHLNLVTMQYALLDLEKLKLASEQALPVFESYLAKHPDDLNGRMNYAEILQFAEQNEKAKNVVDELLRIPNIDSEIIFNASSLYYRMGDKALTLDLLNRAISAGFCNYEAIARTREYISTEFNPLNNED